jgi:TonB family protein
VFPPSQSNGGDRGRDVIEVGHVAPLEPVVFSRSHEERSLLLPGSDADPQPTVRILPVYPPNARGEGWVLVQFDISPAGTVTHAAAIDAQPRGMFEKNALRAIERWRYRPAVMDGRAVERRGLRVLLRFELERT